MAERRDAAQGNWLLTFPRRVREAIGGSVRQTAGHWGVAVVTESKAYKVGKRVLVRKYMIANTAKQQFPHSFGVCLVHKRFISSVSSS